MNETIIFDTETTELDLPEEIELSHQPYITEIYCLKIDKKNNIVSDFHSLFSIPIPVPFFITNLTGIDDNLLRGQATFLDKYERLAKFFIGTETLVAHNLSFDLKMLWIELQRIGKQFNFPYPPIHFCTVEQSLHLEGQRLSNAQLYAYSKGKGIKGAHRAKADVMATFHNYKWLLKQIKKGKK